MWREYILYICTFVTKNALCETKSRKLEVSASLID